MRNGKPVVGRPISWDAGIREFGDGKAFNTEGGLDGPISVRNSAPSCPASGAS